MSWVVFLAALASACLHACWNVAAKRQQVPSEALLGIILVTALVCLLALPFVQFPPLAAWPWLLAAAGCNIVYSRALMIAYDRSNLSFAYPIVRAMLPPMLLVLGWTFFSESPQTTSVAGLAMVAASLLLFAFAGWSNSRTDLRGIPLLMLAGAILSFSYFFDIKGSRLSGNTIFSVIQYGVSSSLMTAAGLSAWYYAERKNPLAILTGNWLSCLVGSALLMASYFLALWAYTRGPIGLVAPVRETSIIFAGVLSMWILNERVGLLKWAAIGLAALGAVLIKFK